MASSSLNSDIKFEKCGKTEKSSVWHPREGGLVLCDSCLLDSRNSSILTFIGDNNLSGPISTTTPTTSSAGSRPLRKSSRKSAQIQQRAGLRSKEKSRRSLTKGKPVKTPRRIVGPLTSAQVCHNGRTFRVGDIVALRDIEDDTNRRYYAQIDGLMTDLFCEKSACLTWMLPSPSAPKDGSFAFGCYFPGPTEDLSRPLDAMEFVCHSRPPPNVPVVMNSVGMDLRGESAADHQFHPRVSPSPVASNRSAPAMFEPSKGRICAAVISALVAYLLYVPLPERLEDHPKVQVIDFFARVLYFYPARFLSMFGPRMQLFWTRSSLGTLIGVTNPIFKSDSEMTIEDTIFAGVPVRLYVPNKKQSDGAIIYVHGGGFVLLSVDAYDGVTRELARKTGMVTVSIEYRLAPEHRFPAAIEDVENATVHFLTEAAATYGVDPNKVAIVGDSAGGNLATVIAQRLRHKKYLPSLKAQALIYPVLQFSDFLSPSYQLYKTYDNSAFMDPTSIARWLSAYIGVDVAGRLDDILANRHVSAHSVLSELRHENLPSDWHNSSHYVAPAGVTVDFELKALMAPFLHNPDFAPLMQPDLTGIPSRKHSRESNINSSPFDTPNCSASGGTRPSNPR